MIVGDICACDFSHLMRQSSCGMFDVGNVLQLYQRIPTLSLEWISIVMEHVLSGKEQIYMDIILDEAQHLLTKKKLVFALDISGSYDGLVRIWDTATGECLKTVYAEGNPPVGCVRFSPNGRFVLSGTLDSKLRLYDVSGGRERNTFGNGHSGLNSNRAQPRGGKCSKTYAGHTNSKFCAFAAFLSANPKRQCVVSGSEDGKIYMYDLQSRLIRQTLEGHHDAVLAVDAHDSLELIGSGGMGNDKFVRFWGPSKVRN